MATTHLTILKKDVNRITIRSSVSAILTTLIEIVYLIFYENKMLNTSIDR